MLSATIASSIQAITPTSPEKIRNLYVNAVTGNDKNSCEMPYHACQSLQAAFDRIPPILSQEFQVNMAAGTYSGEAVLMDRSSPKGYPIRVTGQRGVTLLDGLGQLEAGITVYRAPRVFLEGLSVTGFVRAGVSFAHTGPIEVSTTRIFSNPGTGMEIRDSDVVVVESIVDENGGQGILCDVGRVEFHAEEGGKGVIISRNDGNGVRAIGCHAIFEGPSMITLNRSGLVAEHGAEINLMGRTDVIVTGNTSTTGGGSRPPGNPHPTPRPLSHLPLCELTADNHGLIAGYGNAPVQGSCLCLDSHFGVCDPE
jgi:hypothetical protein